MFFNKILFSKAIHQQMKNLELKKVEIRAENGFKVRFFLVNELGIRWDR